MEAPYFNSTNPNTNLVQEDTCPQRPGEAIYNFEVVEVFFLNDDDDYLEMELAPNGQYLNILLSGSRNDLLTYLPFLGDQVEVNNPCHEQTEPGCVWTGNVTIPTEYLPANITKFNAFAVHGEMENGELITYYESLFPVDEESSGVTEPNFHYLDAFQPIDLGEIGLVNLKESELWIQAKATPQSFSNMYKVHEAYGCTKKAQFGANFSTKRSNGKLIFNVTVSELGHVNYDIPTTQQQPGPNDELFDLPHESVWASFTNEDNLAIRFGINPYGAYLVNLLDDSNILANVTLVDENSLTCSTPTNSFWSCQLSIEDQYFPKDVKYFQLVHHHQPLLSDENKPLPDFEIISASCLGTLEGQPIGGNTLRDLDWVGCLTDNRNFLDSEVNSEHSDIWLKLKPELTTSTT
ncbi:hypothetical protein TCAL_00168 [Tigriopus californicus]|uniref:Uncharacterized protein n=1 Tax=Tigriopus californicus TaxID=6832 RepID=A0A553PFW8_TIGCA|nr:uncharacterized protein LOC131880183 [Tigriopus californicus]TRY76575.1 hypothetical protein TCAL_00168 [Tigriopus californicus]|eukprot:TCALIF_00168-PA protein Name:"Similar to D3Ertd751e UPF0462 protein C4orf33 homolog (Mus musculus)" AED:0.01 eAED:0.01 QI:259/1/1/1/1/1/4/208/406